jgi:hypothetical protein
VSVCLRPNTYLGPFRERCCPRAAGEFPKKDSVAALHGDRKRLFSEADELKGGEVSLDGDVLCEHLDESGGFRA